MGNIIKLGSLYLNSYPVKIGAQYASGQSIEIGEKVPGKEISWVPVNGLLIANRCLLTNISWGDLNAQGLVLGKEVSVQGFKFKIRLLKVGNSKNVPNEWDAALDAVGEDDTLWYWDHKFFWGQESAEVASSRAYRGYYSARYWDWNYSSLRRASLGFRPTLDPLPTEPSALRYGQEVIAIGCDGCVVGNLINMTQYDLLLRTKADKVTGVPSFATDMQDGTLAVDRRGILSIVAA